MLLKRETRKPMQALWLTPIMLQWEKRDKKANADGVIDTTHAPVVEERNRSAVTANKALRVENQEMNHTPIKLIHPALRSKVSRTRTRTHTHKYFFVPHLSALLEQRKCLGLNFGHCSVPWVQAFHCRCCQMQSSHTHLLAAALASAAGAVCAYVYVCVCVRMCVRV
jgi:hypothetical protein